MASNNTQKNNNIVKNIRTSEDNKAAEDNEAVEDNKAAEDSKAARDEKKIDRKAASVLDTYAEDMFSRMGIKKPNAKLCEVYKNYKFVKDKVQPGRMKPAEYATCITIAKMLGV